MFLHAQWRRGAETRGTPEHRHPSRHRDTPPQSPPRAPTTRAHPHGTAPHVAGRPSSTAECYNTTRDETRRYDAGKRLTEYYKQSLAYWNAMKAFVTEYMESYWCSPEVCTSRLCSY